MVGAVGIDVRFIGQSLPPEILGIEIAEATFAGGADVGLIERRRAGF